MRTHRFGRKIKLPASIAVKHQIRVLMAQDELKKAESQLVKQSAPVSEPAATKEWERSAISPKRPILNGAERM
jgi:hypothetical protein